MFSTHQQENLRFKQIICDLLPSVTIMVVENYYNIKTKHKDRIQDQAEH
jgi:hypothetical protein